MTDLPELPPRPFCLIRHGETTANRDGLIAGRLDVALSDLGQAQARALADLSWPRPLALFCSPMTRARDTATLAFPTLVASPIADLRERDWGRFEGRPLAELPPRETTPDGGEDWAAMIRRVHGAISACIAAAGPALPVLVCHSGVIRATRLLVGQQTVGSRAPNATPIHYRPKAGHHEEHLHEL